MGCNCGGPTSEWKAILDKQPPELPRLGVTGTADCTSSGYKNVHLALHNPQGINPRILLLDLVWTDPTGPTNPVITPHQVHYRLPNSPDYDEVVIVNCGDRRIKVEVVH
jgi:hypothetical protein